VHGGLTFREARYLCEAVAATNNLASMDLVEVNPKIGDELHVKDTLQTAIMLVRHALGETLL
jgi:arginase